MPIDPSKFNSGLFNSPDLDLDNSQQEFIGSTFDNKYRIVDVIGAGGMGTVYLAEDTLLGNTVALKKIHPVLATDQVVRRRFLQEVALSQRIFSTNVVRVHDARQCGDELYYTMEYLEGVSLMDHLDSLIEADTMLSIRDVKRIMSEICRGLADAHRVTLHRDLKPDNIFLLADGGVKLLDFGLARALKGSGLTKDAKRMGTAYYMAPEMLSKNEFEPKPTLDIYALGVMLYEMLTLELPLAGMEPISEFRDDAPERIDGFIRKCVSRRPSRRPKTVSDFLTEFNALFSSHSPTTEIAESSDKTELGRERITNNEQRITNNELLTSRSRTIKNSERSTSHAEPSKTQHPTPKTDSRAAGAEWTVPEIGMKMIWVPPGKFMMGSADNDPDAYSWEKPQHKVELTSGYWIGKYPVTQEEYKQVMGTNPSHFKGPRNPVERVSWKDAMAFCKKLSEVTGKEFTLPTEARWEYAARGGSESKRYKYAGSNDVKEVAWFEKNSGEIKEVKKFLGLKRETKIVNQRTHPVGELKSNELGIHDMSGNVWEWCLDDWHDDYNGAPGDDSRWGDGSGSSRVLRGGSWSSIAGDCRSALRYWDSPSSTYDDLGFRVLRTDS